MEGVLCSCTSVLAMKFGSNSKRKTSERKREQECVHQTWKPRHGEPSIKREMMYEMEKILAIVMSSKGSYPKYIKRHTIQKQWNMHVLSLRSGGKFCFVWGLTNTSEMKRNKTPVRQGKIYIYLKSGFQKILATDKKKRHRWGATNEPAQVKALDPWHDHLSASWGQPDIVHWQSHCPATWYHHCQGRPGVYYGTWSVLRSIWPRRAHTVSVSCPSLLWVS